MAFVRFLRTYFTARFKRVMLLYTMMIIVSVVGITGVVIYHTAVTLHIDEAIKYDSNKVEQIGQNMEQTIRNYSSMINRITLNHQIDRVRLRSHYDLQTLLKQPWDTSEQKRELEVDMLAAMMDEIAFTDGLSFIYLYDLHDIRARFQYSREAGGRGYVTLDKSKYDPSGIVKWTVEQDLIVANRTILDVYNFETIGYFSMGVKQTYLKNMIVLNEQRNVLILDRNHEVVLYHGQENEADMSSVIPHLETTGRKTFIYNAGDLGRVLVTSHYSPYLDWTIVSMVALEEITSGPHMIGQWVVAIGAGGIVFGMLLSWMFSLHVVRPLRRLIKVMDSIDQGRFDFRIPVDRPDEFGKLARSFNRMMDKINELIHSVWQGEIRQKEAEFKTLQAQINPHFLYNTLDTIRWLAETEEHAEVAKVAVSLSNLMKAGFKSSAPFHTLQDELNYIYDYLLIQKTRFQDKIDTSFQVDPHMLPALVPRLILQPLIENAIIHGLENKLGKGRLFVNIHRGRQDELHMTVTDDGIGMSPEALAELRDKLADDRSNEQAGGGIANVHQRIQLLYGTSYGVGVESAERAGTTVTMTMPCRFKA